MKLHEQLHKLNYFRHIIEAGSIQEGAKRAFIGQPQMSKVLKSLEDNLNVKLVVRSKKGIAPTAEGQALFDFSKETLRNSDILELKLRSKGEHYKGEIRIGTYDSIGRYFFPEFILFFNKSFPNIKIFLKTGKSDNMAKDLKNRKLDVAVIINASNYRGLVHENIFQDSFGLFYSPGLQPKFQKRLIYYNFPLNDINQSLVKFGFSESISCDNIETVKLLTEKALGIGIMPHRVAKDGIIGQKLIEYKHPKIKSNSFDQHNIDLCYKKNIIQNNDLIHFFNQELKRYLSLWSQR